MDNQNKNTTNTVQKESWFTRYSRFYVKSRIVCWYIMVFFMAIVSLAMGKIGIGLLFFVAGVIDLPPVKKRFPTHTTLLTVLSIVLAVIAALLYQA